MELNKAVLDCMQTLRRRLRDELGADIHLNQSDAVSALLGACERSDSVRTRELGEELARLCAPQPAPAAQEERAQPLYRGQEVPATAEPAAAPAAPEERQVRIYRGQRVYS
ncbi:hypothetical protein D3C78_1061810 [compost metagenome]